LSNGTNGFGISIKNSNSTIINSNIIRTNGTGASAITLSNGAESHNIITNNDASSYSIYGVIDMDMTYGFNNSFSNNTLRGFGTNGYGVYFESDSSNQNIFSNMKISTNGTSAYAFYVNAAKNNFTITDSF